MISSTSSWPTAEIAESVKYVSRPLASLSQNQPRLACSRPAKRAALRRASKGDLPPFWDAVSSDCPPDNFDNKRLILFANPYLTRATLTKRSERRLNYERSAVRNGKGLQNHDFLVCQVPASCKYRSLRSSSSHNRARNPACHEGTHECLSRR